MATENSKCPHCSQHSLRTVGQSIDCTNRDCDAYTVTLPPAQFMALTPAQLASYQTGRSERVRMGIEQVAFEARIAQLERDLEARQAARVAGERVYG